MQIEVRNLKKTYVTYKRGSTFREVAASIFRREAVPVHALSGINFSVEKGELVGFMGPNGAGKSTTLKILTGVLYPTEGSVSVLGCVPWKQRRKYVSRIGAVFGQKSQLIWDIPPLDSFMMNQAIYRVPDAEFTAALDRLTGMLDIREQMRQPTRNLSLGERMKCEFIMAMLHGPEIVFLDEPTIGLDVTAKEKIREFILEMNGRGVTFILTTHDLDDVERLARRVIVVNHGEIVFDDAIDQLKRSLGNLKKVRITTGEPSEIELLPGLTLTEKKTGTEAEFELDMDLLPMSRFITYVNERYPVKDISLEDIPIERVIKELYARKV